MNPLLLQAADARVPAAVERIRAHILEHLKATPEIEQGIETFATVAALEAVLSELCKGNQPLRDYASRWGLGLFHPATHP